MIPYYSDASVTIYHMDCREFEGKADVIVTDPPYGLEFMGKEWDCIGKGWNDRASATKTGQDKGDFSWFGGNVRPRYGSDGPAMQAWHTEWAKALLGKAGWLFAFGGTRTWHRLACAIEDAGWQYRDTIMWLYGQGFPKGHNNLKPAWEPILVARKYGNLDIDAGRIEGAKPSVPQSAFNTSNDRTFGFKTGFGRTGEMSDNSKGRWPANLILDEEAAAMLDEQSGEHPTSKPNSVFKRASSRDGHGNIGAAYGAESRPAGDVMVAYGDFGGASRFFYCAKASRSERGDGNDHPTVKPLKLMEYLITLSGGQLILDPFMGSGTTLVAAKRLGRKAIGIDTDEHSCEIAAKRCKAVFV